MDLPPSQKINNLIDRLFGYKDDRRQVTSHIISMGSSVIPELLTAFRKREFRESQNSELNTAKFIAKAIVEIAKNEQDLLVRDKLFVQIINEMAVHAGWQIEITLSSREDFDRYKKAFDDSLYTKACEAALILGALQDSRALPVLFNVATNEFSHPTIKENGIMALGQIGDEQAIPYLIGLVDSHDYNTHHAIDALVKIGSIEAVPHLLNSLEKAWDADVQAAVIWALGQLYDPRAVPKLIEWVETNISDMRAVAIQALGSIRYTSAIPVLESCLDDRTMMDRHDMGGTFWLFRSYRDQKISDMALEALQEIGTQDAMSAIERWRARQG